MSERSLTFLRKLPARPTDEPSRPEPEDPREALSRLRGLLLGSQKAELASVRDRLEDEDYWSDEIARNLPAALKQGLLEDEELADALAPYLEHALARAVAENPDAIAKLMAPAVELGVRRALAKILRDILANTRYLKMAAAIATVAVVFFLGQVWLRDARWSSFVRALESEPGILVEATRADGGLYLVSGKRDPLATEIGALLAAHGVPRDRVRLDFEPHVSLDPPIVLTRAESRLTPPESVRLELSGSTLRATGAAEASWIGRARELAPMLDGIDALDSSGLINLDLKRLVEELESKQVFFEAEGSSFATGQAEELSRLAEHLRIIDDMTRTDGPEIEVTLMGYAGGSLPPDRQTVLSRERAEALKGWLAEQLPELGLRLDVVGVGAIEPLPGIAEEDGDTATAVKFRVKWIQSS